MKSFKTLVKTPYEKMLVACLAARQDANYAEIALLHRQCQQRRLFEFAQEHECAGIVATRLEKIGQSTPQWDAVAADWKYRLSLRFEALDALAEALDARHIPLIALKNAGIARAIYPYYEECPMGDFDVLVCKKDFENAHEIVVSQGFDLDFRAKETIEEKGIKASLLSGGAEYKKDLGDDTLWLELQWRSIAGRWIAPEVEPKAEDLFASSIAVPNSKIRIQSPEDNLLQVALHTAKHSYVRAPGLRLHTDVDRIVRAYPDLNWDAFVERVCAMNVKTAVYFSLQIPADLFQTPIPQNVLDRLRPNAAKARFIFDAIARAGLFHPLRSKFSRLQYLAFTAVLFDSPAACLRSAFPSPNYMRNHYAISTTALPTAYAKRFANLLFKRVKT